MNEETCATVSDLGRRPQFGARYLTDESKVFECNAWDDVEWDDEQRSSAEQQISANCSKKMSEEEAERLESDADKHWDVFYSTHQSGFFKDRNWLFTEFPELNRFSVTQSCDDKFKVLEVGCGVGNTVFPLLEANKNTDMFVYCCDFSATAISLLKKNTQFDEKQCRPFVWNFASTSSQFPADDFPLVENSVDVILMIFVLSAVEPAKMERAVQNLVTFLKPGGVLLFRDYGRYDMAQLRFRNGHCISENFYARGDKTRVYFFEQDEVNELFTKCGLTKLDNRIDRRLQVNRARMLKMYRIWIQCKYVKLHSV